MFFTVKVSVSDCVVHVITFVNSIFSDKIPILDEVIMKVPVVPLIVKESSLTTVESGLVTDTLKLFRILLKNQKKKKKKF